MKIKIITFILAATISLTALSGCNPAEPNMPDEVVPTESSVIVESTAPPAIESIQPEPPSFESAAAPEQESYQEEMAHPIPAEQREIYYNFFRNNFEVREIEHFLGSGRSMSHNIHGEVRQTETVFFNNIEGFDYPVLVIWEFPPDSYSGVGTAYLIRNGELESDLSRAEFEAIFREIEDRSFLAIHENEYFVADINGENLIAVRIRDEYGEGMDILLNWLSEG